MNGMCQWGLNKLCLGDWSQWRWQKKTKQETLRAMRWDCPHSCMAPEEALFFLLTPPCPVTPLCLCLQRKPPKSCVLCPITVRHQFSAVGDDSTNVLPIPNSLHYCLIKHPLHAGCDTTSNTHNIRAHCQHKVNGKPTFCPIQTKHWTQMWKVDRFAYLGGKFFKKTSVWNCMSTSRFCQGLLDWERRNKSSFIKNVKHFITTTEPFSVPAYDVTPYYISSSFSLYKASWEIKSFYIWSRLPKICFHDSFSTNWNFILYLI